MSSLPLARLDLHLLWEEPGPGGHGRLAGVGGAVGEDLLGLRPGWHSGWGRGSDSRGDGRAVTGAATAGSAGAHLAAGLSSVGAITGLCLPRGGPTDLGLLLRLCP